MNNYLQHLYSMRWALCAGCVDLYVYLVLKSAPKQVLDIPLAELSKNLYTSVNSIKKYRDKLVLAGLVGYDAGTPQQVCSKFTIFSATASNFDVVSPVTASNFDVVSPATASNFDVVIPATASNFDVVIPVTASNFDTVNTNSANILNETISNFDAVFHQSNPAYILSKKAEEKTEKPITTILVKEKVKKISKRGVLMVLAYPTFEDFILPMQKLVPAMGLDEVQYWYNQAVKWSDGINGGPLQYKINWCKAVKCWRIDNPYQYQNQLKKQQNEQKNDKMGVVAGSSANKELIQKLDFEVQDWQNKISKLKSEVQKLMFGYETCPEDREMIKIELEKLSTRQKKLEYELGLAQIRRQKLD